MSCTQVTELNRTYDCHTLCFRTIALAATLTLPLLANVNETRSQEAKKDFYDICN
jgi:hypothetical protein